MLRLLSSLHPIKEISWKSKREERKCVERSVNEIRSQDQDETQQKHHGFRNKPCSARDNVKTSQRLWFLDSWERMDWPPRHLVNQEMRRIGAESFQMNTYFPLTRCFEKHQRQLPKRSTPSYRAQRKLRCSERQRERT